jgi:hypothetical protein
MTVGFKNNERQSGVPVTTVEMSKDEREPLSPEQGAFVIQFRTSADVEQGRFTGRMEHVASGQVGHFQTPEQLVAFVRHVLCGRHSTKRLEEL